MGGFLRGVNGTRRAFGRGVTWRTPGVKWVVDWELMDGAALSMWVLDTLGSGLLGGLAVLAGVKAEALWWVRDSLFCVPSSSGEPSLSLTNWVGWTLSKPTTAGMTG